MNSSPKIEHLKTALRIRLCGECSVRPAENAPAATATATGPAPCESDCQLYVNLPKLARLVKEGEPPCGYEVFAKSLASQAGKSPGTDIVLALAILESALAELSKLEADQPAGCERLDRITAAVACLPKEAEQSVSVEGIKEKP
jgi:hypothetical protein